MLAVVSIMILVVELSNQVLAATMPTPQVLARSHFGTMKLLYFYCCMAGLPCPLTPGRPVSCLWLAGYPDGAHRPGNRGPPEGSSMFAAFDFFGRAIGRGRSSRQVFESIGAQG